MHPLGTPEAPDTTAFAPLEAPPKKQGGVFLVVLSVLVAGGLAWGGMVASQQIRQQRNREFLLEVVQQHLSTQRAVEEHLGVIESLTLNEALTEQNAASGAVVFEVAGSRGSARVVGLQRPNGLEFELRLPKGEPILLEPFVASGMVRE